MLSSVLQILLEMYIRTLAPLYNTRENATARVIYRRAPAPVPRCPCHRSKLLAYSWQMQSGTYTSYQIETACTITTKAHSLGGFVERKTNTEKGHLYVLGVSCVVNEARCMATFVSPETAYLTELHRWCRVARLQFVSQLVIKTRIYHRSLIRR